VVEEEHQEEEGVSQRAAEVVDFLEVAVEVSVHQEDAVPLEAEDVDFKCHLRGVLVVTRFVALWLCFAVQK